MPAAILDLELEQGVTYRRQLLWKHSAEGDPVDLTNYSARMHVRRYAESGEVLVELTSEPPAGITLGGAAGTIYLELTAAQTQALPTPAVYDMLLTEGDGDTVRFIKGDVRTSVAVTR